MVERGEIERRGKEFGKGCEGRNWTRRGWGRARCVLVQCPRDSERRSGVPHGNKGVLEMRNRKWIGLMTGILALAMVAGAQQDNPQQNNSFYQVTLVGKTITSVSYQHRQGSTMIDFRGTPLLPLSKGNAKVDSKQGSIVISAKFRDLQPAQMFGKEYLTYVLWAITPEGKPNNLGEVLLDGTKSKLTATTNLQSFGMIVTAEPYFAVNMPSDVVVLENVVRSDTAGTFEQVTANYELIQRGQYTYITSKAKDD